MDKYLSNFEKCFELIKKTVKNGFTASCNKSRFEPIKNNSIKFCSFLNIYEMNLGDFFVSNI